MAAALPSKDDIFNAFSGEAVSAGRQLLLQVLHHGIATQNHVPEVVALLKVLLFQHSDESDSIDLEAHVVDTIWLVSCSLIEEEPKKKGGDNKDQQEEETGTNGNKSSDNTSRDALIQILQVLVGTEEGEEENESLLSKKKSLAIQLQSHLDPSLLERAELVASEKDLMKKLRMLNTKNYRQHKFNLLQEESEGYAKVLETLVKQDYSQLKTIMGTFHVDPNRILDLALDVLIHKSSSTPQDLGWLKEFAIPKIPALMAFKLRNSESAADSQRILKTIAFLAIQEPDILPLSKMARYLEPITPQLEQTFPLYLQIERKRVRNVGRVRLGGSSAAQTKEAERDAQDQAKLQGLVKDLETTYRIQLLDILLKQQQWKVVQTLFPNFSELKQVFTLFPTLGLAVCDWLQQQLTPLFNKYCPVPEAISQGEEKMEVDPPSDTSVDIASAGQVVDLVSDPLLCILDSSCTVMRPTLFCQLCRILRALLLNEKGAKEDAVSPDPALYTFIQSFLLPSLSLFPANPSLAMEVWSILQLFPYTTRYQLYRDWRGVGLEKAGLQLFGEKKKTLVVVESEMHAGKDARYVLKRLSKETIRESCRQIAKVTHSNPLVMFTTVLNQIESYDNLVSVMVDALRFVSPLGMDVLGFCMLSRLCGSSSTDGDRSRSKEGGINVALWLQSMESFIGTFYERHPLVEFRGIICYVMRRLRYGHVTELGVLRSLLKTTGGWNFADYSPAASLSAAQIEGRAGSTLLKRETMTFGVVEGFNLRSSRQLRYVLQSEDMGVSLLILLAQVRSRIVFDNKSGRPKPVKLIGTLFDTTQVVMSTMLDFLTKSSEEVAQTSAGSNGAENGTVQSSDKHQSNNELVKYAMSMPKLYELVEVYGIDMATAWMLCRPLIRAAESVNNGSSEGDPVGAFAMTEKARSAYKPLVRSEKIWDDISPEFFEMFYTYTIYDLFCPGNIYNTEIYRLNKEVERLSQRQNQGGPQFGAGAQPNTGDEVERLKRVASVLSSQLSNQLEHVEAIHKKFQSNQDAANLYFPSNQVSVSAVNTFLSNCIFPRSMQGPDDALYCAHFVFLLHTGETPGFSTLHFLDELFPVLSSSLFGVTEGEAANLSILLLETWKFVSRWRYDEKAYEEEVAGKPGSFMVDPAEDDVAESNAPRKEGNIYSVSHEQYKALFVKWHTSIGAAAVGCLKSSEYMHTRASLIVLSRIVEVFPSRPNLGNKLFEVLEPLKSEENSALPDIRSAAQAYTMQLSKARADGVWKEEDKAVVEARIKAEKEAQELRKKQAAERFDELKMESEKITAEMGTDEHRGRGDRFGGRDRDRRGRPGDNRDFPRGAPPPVHDDRRSPLVLEAAMPSFEPPPRRSVGGDLPRGGGDRGGDRRVVSTGRDDFRPRDVPPERRRDSEVRVVRDSGPLLGSLGRAESHAPPPPRGVARNDPPPPRGGGRGPSEEEPRGLEGRWEGSRPGGGGGGAGGRGRPKRQRSRSPGADRDRGDSRGGRDGGDRDEIPSKRQRTEGHGSHRTPGHGSGGGGGGGGGRRSRR